MNKYLMTPQTKIFLSCLLLIAMITGSCSKNEFDPEDYITSMLSGEYKKDGLWKLYVTANGNPLDNYGSVRFESKYLKEGDFKFIDVIPGEAKKEFKDIPLSASEEGIEFTIEYTKNNQPILITGTIDLGEMKVNIAN